MSKRLVCTTSTGCLDYYEHNEHIDTIRIKIDMDGELLADGTEIKAEDFLEVVRAHAKQGVDFVTIHAGINRRTVELFKEDKRRMNIVSRGGSLLFAWMEMTGNENPFYEYYDELLDILLHSDENTFARFSYNLGVRLPFLGDLCYFSHSQRLVNRLSYRAYF